MVIKNKKTKKFQSRILYVNIIALLVITLLLFGIFAVYYIHENKERLEEITEQWAESAGNTLEQNLFFVDNKQMGNTPYIRNIMDKLYYMEEEGKYFDREWIEKKEIVQYLMPYLLKEDMIYRIFIYNRNGDFLMGGASTTLAETLKYLEDPAGRYMAKGRQKCRRGILLI